MIDGHGGPIEALIAVLVGFVFAGVYFSLLGRVADTVLLWWTVLLGIPLVWIAMQLQLLAPAG